MQALGLGGDLDEEAVNAAAAAQVEAEMQVDGIGGDDGLGDVDTL